MNEQNPHRATIPPVADGVPRPLWSVMIPTYHCTQYLRETLISVLQQDPGAEQMQIEVVDDHSTLDDPEALVQSIGQGRVHFYRQPENVGYIKNFETCLQRSRGHLIHLLHGDDYVRPGFYQKLQQLFARHSEIGAAYCRHICTDGAGHWQTLSPLEQTTSGLLTEALTRIVCRHPIQTPSIVVKRQVYEALGGFDRRMVSCGEDWEMWVRIASNYAVGYETEPLAVYRSHPSSLSGRAFLTGQNMRDMRQAIDIITSHLPASNADHLLAEARQLWGYWGLYQAANQLLVHRRITSALAQFKEAWQCSRSPQVFLSVLTQLLKDSRDHWVQQTLSKQH